MKLSKRLLQCVASIAFIILALQPALAGSKGALSDSWITTKIEAKYAVDPQLNPFKIHVTTKNGTVTLEGTVGSAEEIEKAADIAYSVKGVRHVEFRNLLVKKKK